MFTRERARHTRRAIASDVGATLTPVVTAGPAGAARIADPEHATSVRTGTGAPLPEEEAPVGR
ncbi:hypothetical protein [Embleya sp. NPDC059237]|uniref:hypothetical protein n=1 Tax=Embleya sp. NPDC059237 TaxID=3346784 RepID=UPI003694D6B1